MIVHPMQDRERYLTFWEVIPWIEHPAVRQTIEGDLTLRPEVDFDLVRQNRNASLQNIDSDRLKPC